MGGYKEEREKGEGRRETGKRGSTEGGRDRKRDRKTEMGKKKTKFKFPCGVESS